MSIRRHSYSSLQWISLMYNMTGTATLIVWDHRACPSLRVVEVTNALSAEKTSALRNGGSGLPNQTNYTSTSKIIKSETWENIG